ncbi:MAG: type VI secretion system protein TssR domain-containing protein [Mucilaginibacter sp.]|uniref:type VI secretion system protein TssR domain-containing protein n=1 Tax=Mucilaginibacter sp. TaxID=1882438 RepID=UPI0031A36C63
MKKIFLLLVLLIHTVFVMAQLTLPFQRKVQPMPKAFGRPNAATDLNGNGAKTNTPWIVYSDRDDNFTTTTPGGSLFMKKLGFMEPFYVSEEKNGFLKLIKYNAGLLTGRKINDKKNATSYGWISRWKLLMWNRSYTDQKTGYPEKSIAIINGKLPLTSSQFYYDRTDSAFVYSSPELKKVIAKVRLHQINYIFKRSEDGRKYLIGNEDQLVADSARKVIYGWIAADAVHNWGQRLYISPAVIGSDAQTDSASMILNQEHADPLLGQNDMILKSSPVISNTSAGYVLGKATDVYNKSQNTLITIDGSLLKYPDYLNLRKNIHNINVVFVIDASSSMKKYFPGLTNTVQSLENVFNEFDKKNRLSYGAVVYRDDNNCSARGIERTDAIYPDYRKLMSFLGTQAEKTKQCNSNVTAEPLYEGVRTALDMFKTHESETNLVILVGSVGDSTEHFKQLSERFGRENARLLTIQMYSEYNEWYNNFVLNAKKLVSESAVYAAERKKGFLINGEGLNDKQTYNVSHQDSVSFYLDYPNNSLIQGGVVFPTKGEVNSKKYITTATRRFLKETETDIHDQITSLDSAFRLRGIANANLAEAVKAQLPQLVGEDVADKMPHNAFKYYMTSIVPADVVAKNSDLLQYTLVLNNAEFKQLNDIIALMVGQNLEADKSSFRKQLVKNYLSIPRNLLDLDLSNGTVRSMTLAQYFKTVTGLPIQNKLFDQFTVRDLKSDSHMPRADFERYIKFLINSADNIKLGTQVGQQFISNGKTYYYITRDNFTANPEK